MARMTHITYTGLACKGLTLTVAGRTFCRDLDLHIEPGEVWCVLGPNGSGKTTLINALSGLAAATGGAVAIGDVPLAAMTGQTRARTIGVLPQHEESEFWGSVLEYVLLGRFPHASPWAAWQHDDPAPALDALDQMGLTGFAARRYATLSGGERQRVRMAQLLAQAPRYLLLDEPLQHLDLHHQIAMLRHLAALAREKQHGVLMVLHDVLWPARVCTHALLLDGAGGARAGTAGAVLTQGHLEALFGCALNPAGDNPLAGFVPAI
jgi:iron complex transport system ATP-binding protein